MNFDWYEFRCPPGYAALTHVQAPEGFREVSRIVELVDWPNDSTRKCELVKVFFEKEEKLL